VAERLKPMLRGMLRLLPKREVRPVSSAVQLRRQLGRLEWSDVGVLSHVVAQAALIGLRYIPLCLTTTTTKKEQRHHFALA
jgi:hypothetical protein